MKRLPTIFACILSLAACTRPCSVVWTEGNTDPETGYALHSLTIVNPPSGTDWTLWFSQFRTPIRVEEGSAADIVHVSGTLYRLFPTEARDRRELTVRYSAKALANQCRAPEAFFLQQKGGNPAEVKYIYNYLPCEDVKSFEYTKQTTAPEDIIPQIKKISRLGGSTDASAEPIVEKVEGQVNGWYRITIDGGIRIEAADEDGEWYAKVTLENIIRNAAGQPLGNMVIEDWPDMIHRGIMLDVSRNFTSKDNLLKLIDLLAHYKANVLHLHFGDDEGWRIEIDGLPELTSYSAHRCIPVLAEDGSYSEPDGLQMTYSAHAGDGFYSHADFVEILRYAKERHIRVIPEFDTPGHSRAAIKGMEMHAAATSDNSFLLSEAADESEYVSVQDYVDNAINVALPSTYAFISKVFDALIAMYREAGAELPAIHVGGDEVPEGAWEGSPACQKLMQDNGWSDTAMLKDYYVRNVALIAAEKGVKLAGWQELVQNLRPRTLRILKENLLYTNLWSVSGGKDELAYTFANNGIPVVLSNASNTYLDFAYNPGKTERGHNWGGYVDERRSFCILPYNIYRSVRWDDHGNIRDISNADEGKAVLGKMAMENIIGIQGQLWAETLRSFDHVTYYIFPKALGLFERGWNARPEWERTTVSDDPTFTSAFDKFYSIVVDNEMPYYDSMGISYHRN